ncbi:hypothetical protein D4R51_01970 [bacterium]|nr:MAG: hypothetical protein D4R51_01970 [bacterium]
MSIMFKYSFALIGLGMFCFLTLALPNIKNDPNQWMMRVFGIAGICLGVVGILFDMTVDRIEKAIKKLERRQPGDPGDGG